MTTKIKFTKMHGAGNDYIYVDTTRCPIADPEKKAIEWSKFHTGIGSGYSGRHVSDRSTNLDPQHRDCLFQRVECH